MESITIGRDLASGLRLAGLLVACGLILGRAAAGDFESYERMFHDLAFQGWPAVALTLAAAVVQRLLRPTARTPEPSAVRAGLLPALAYVLAAAAYVWVLGPWRGTDGGR